PLHTLYRTTHAHKPAQVQICPSRPLAPRDPSLRSGFRLRDPVAARLTPANRLKFKSARPDHLLLEILRCAQDFACGLPSLRSSRPQDGSSSNLPVPTTCPQSSFAALRTSPAASRRSAPPPRQPAQAHICPSPPLPPAPAS